ncbi:hypothetical protein [Salipaludibacillus agaradhaerens]|nr:hypothetical protein [Salipaludibacillus agaradhaerens]
MNKKKVGRTAFFFYPQRCKIYTEKETTTDELLNKLLKKVV